jgi:cell division protein FtsQ
MAQRAAQSRAFRLRAALVTGVVVALVVATLAIYRSQLFAIEDVEITGVEMLAAEAVRAHVDLPGDATLLRFPRSAIESRLTSDPWIAEVSITRRLPSTLAIAIVERTPAALLDTGTAFWFVDAGGRFLGESSLESTGSVLPVIRDVPDAGPVAGEVTESPALLNALHVLTGLSEELAGLVRGVSAASAHETTLITETSVEIMIGEAVQIPEKSALALGIMAEQGADVVFIDVRSIDRPISRGLGR